MHFCDLMMKLLQFWNDNEILLYIYFLSRSSCSAPKTLSWLQCSFAALLETSSFLKIFCVHLIVIWLALASATETSVQSKRCIGLRKRKISSAMRPVQHFDGITISCFNECLISTGSYNTSPNYAASVCPDNNSYSPKESQLFDQDELNDLNM